MVTGKQFISAEYVDFCKCFYLKTRSENIFSSRKLAKNFVHLSCIIVGPVSATSVVTTIPHLPQWSNIGSTVRVKS